MGHTWATAGHGPQTSVPWLLRASPYRAPARLRRIARRPGGIPGAQQARRYQRYTSAIEIDVRDADNAERLATYLNRVSTRDRIKQLDAPMSTTEETTDPKNLARELVERFGADALAKVAELLAVAT